MTTNPITWVVAAIEVVTALGIAGFWVTWLREPHDEEWLPAGYIEHETPFVFTDSLLALVLVVGAVLQVAEQPAGESLGLIAAGMLAFLGVLDLGYFARTGMFAADKGGLPNAGVVAGTLVAAAVLIVRFF